MALQVLNPIVGIARCLRYLVRSLAVVSLWLILVGFFGMSYIVGGKGQPGPIEVLEFIGAFAIASAIAAVVALVLAGRRRWAVEVMLPVFFVLVAPLSASYLLFWLVPTFTQELMQMNAVDLQSFRRANLRAALDLAGVTAPTGVILGSVIGTGAGLLLVLAGRRPRLVGWLLAGLLLSCVASYIQIDIFRGLTDFVVQTRLRNANRLEYAWYMKHKLASAMGATAGALVGSTVAWLALRIQHAIKLKRCANEG